MEAHSEHRNAQLVTKATRLGVISGLTVWFSFLASIYISTHILVTLALLLLAGTGFVGLYASNSSTTRDASLQTVGTDAGLGMLKTFRLMLQIWIMVAITLFGVFLVFDQLSPLADYRCSKENTPFVELYGANCTLSHQFPECQRVCKEQVKIHVLAESICFIGGVCFALMAVVGEVDGLVAAVEDIKKPPGEDSGDEYEDKED